MSRVRQDADRGILDLTATKIRSEQTAKKVAQWIKDNQPKEVILDDCGITTKSLRVLSLALRRNAKLLRLSLLRNHIGQSSCAAVSDILRKNSSIRYVNLLGNRICPDDSGDAESDDGEEIQDFVDTCNEMRNIRSVCGCDDQQHEVSVSIVQGSAGFNSDVLLLGMELKLSTHLKSLQFRGFWGLSEVFEALKDNTSVVRAKFCDLAKGQSDFDLALVSFLIKNYSLRTLQMGFAGGRRSESKCVLLCVLRGLAQNVGATCLQLENWHRDHETVSALGAMLRRNSTLLHLALFHREAGGSHAALRAEDMHELAAALTFNKTLRVLFIHNANMNTTHDLEGQGPRSSGEMGAGVMGAMRTVGTRAGGGGGGEDGGKLAQLIARTLLTPDTCALLEQAARKRGAPLIVRTEHRDYVFGAGIVGQWEVEDRLEVQVDEDTWETATLLCVSSDRCAVRLGSGAIRHCRQKLLRAGAHFHRFSHLPLPSPTNTLPPTTGTGAGVEGMQALEGSSGPLGETERGPMGTGLGLAEDEVVWDTEAPSERLPVCYAVGQSVQVRFLGESDLFWCGATVLVADNISPTQLLTVLVEVPVPWGPGEPMSGGAEERIDSSSKGQGPGGVGAGVERVVLEVLEVEAPWVRPCLPLEHSPFHLHLQQGVARGEARPHYDAGAFQRGDYVEVRMPAAPSSSRNQEDWGTVGMDMDQGMGLDQGGECELEWRRGRVSLDLRDGSYTVRMEGGSDELVRGMHLRYHFRPRDVVDCKLSGSAHWRSALVLYPDKPEARGAQGVQGTPGLGPGLALGAGEGEACYTVVFEDGRKERSVSVRRIMPSKRANVRECAKHMQVLYQLLPTPAPSSGTGGTGAGTDMGISGAGMDDMGGGIGRGRGVPNGAGVGSAGEARGTGPESETPKVYQQHGALYAHPPHRSASSAGARQPSTPAPSSATPRRGSHHRVVDSGTRGGGGQDLGLQFGAVSASGSGKGNAHVPAHGIHAHEVGLGVGAGVTEGQHVRLYNAALRRHELCVVQAVFPGGLFDALSQQGDLYRHVHPSSLDPGPGADSELLEADLDVEPQEPTSLRGMESREGREGWESRESSARQSRRGPSPAHPSALRARSSVESEDGDVLQRTSRDAPLYPQSYHQSSHPRASSSPERVLFQQHRERRSHQHPHPQRQSEPRGPHSSAKNSHGRRDWDGNRDIDGDEAMDAQQRGFSAGDPVLALVETIEEGAGGRGLADAWLPGVCVGRLGPDLYSVLLEGATAERTFAWTFLREAVSMGVDMGEGMGVGMGMGMGGPEFLDSDGYEGGGFDGTGSFDGSFDDDALIVARSSDTAALDPASYEGFAHRNGEFELSSKSQGKSPIQSQKRPKTAPGPKRQMSSGAHMHAQLRSNSAQRRSQGSYSRRLDAGDSDRAIGDMGDRDRDWSRDRDWDSRDLSHAHAHSKGSRKPVSMAMGSMEMGSSLVGSMGGLYPGKEAYFDPSFASLDLALDPISGKGAGQVQGMGMQAIEGVGVEAVSPLTEFGACFRSHCAPLVWTPMVVFARTGSDMGWGVEGEREVTVMPCCEFATFSDAQARAVFSMRLSSDSRGLLGVRFAHDAPPQCPVKLAFYLDALLVAQVHFTVATQGNLSASAGGPGGDLTALRQYGCEAEARWATASAPMYKSLYLLCVSGEPGGDNDCLLNITHSLVTESLLALPAGMTVLQGGGVDLEAVDAIQVIVACSRLGRDQWQCALGDLSLRKINAYNANTTHTSFSRSAGPSRPSKLCVSTFDPQVQVGSLDALGLQHTNFSLVSPALAAHAWAHESAPATAALKTRFFGTIKALSDALEGVQCDFPVGMVLLPAPLSVGDARLEAGLLAEAVRSLDGGAEWRLYFLQDLVAPDEAEGEWGAPTYSTSHQGGGSGGEPKQAYSSVPIRVDGTLADLIPLLQATASLMLAAQIAKQLHAPALPVRLWGDLFDTGALEGLLQMYTALQTHLIAHRFRRPAPPPVVADADIGANLDVGAPDVLLSCAVRHLEQALLAILQQDLSRVAAVKGLLRQPQSQLVRLGLGIRSYWISPRDLHTSWRVLTDLMLPVGPGPQHGQHVSIQLDLEARQGSAVADWTQRGEGALLGTDLQTSLVQVLTQDVGIQDAYSAKEAAGCLVAQGCTSYADLVATGGLFASTEGKVNTESLRAFLHEAGIPLFIAAKIAAFVKNKLNA